MLITEVSYERAIPCRVRVRSEFRERKQGTTSTTAKTKLRDFANVFGHSKSFGLQSVQKLSQN